MQCTHIHDIHDIHADDRNVQARCLLQVHNKVKTFLVEKKNGESVYGARALCQRSGSL